MKAFLAGTILAAAVIFAAFNFHVVRTGDGLVAVKKAEASFKDIFVDITAWGFGDLWAHRRVVTALARAGMSDRLPEYRRYAETVKSGATSLAEAVKSGADKIGRINQDLGIAGKLKSAAEDTMDLIGKAKVREQIMDGTSKAADGAAKMIDRMTDR